MTAFALDREGTEGVEKSRVGCGKRIKGGGGAVGRIVLFSGEL